MSDLVEDFLAREKDGLAGLENEIPSAFDGEKFLINYSTIIDLTMNFPRKKRFHVESFQEIMYQIWMTLKVMLIIH